jgi:phage tail protein X
MKFVTIKTETSLAELTRDVFEIKGTKAASAAKTAQAALREANPHVADLKKVPSGTLVVVPDVPGIKAAPAQSIEGVSVEMMRQLKSALAAAKAVVEKSTAAQVEDAEASASLAKNRDLVALAKQTPELKQRLSQVVDQAKNQAKQIADDKKAQIQALTQLEKDLATLSSG